MVISLAEKFFNEKKCIVKDLDVDDRGKVHQLSISLHSRLYFPVTPTKAWNSSVFVYCKEIKIYAVHDISVIQVLLDIDV